MWIFESSTSSSEEGNNIFRIHSVVDECDENSRVVYVIDDTVIQHSRSFRRSFDHILITLRELSSQHSGLNHVLEAVLVRRRIGIVSRVGEVAGEVDSFAVHERYKHEIVGQVRESFD